MEKQKTNEKQDGRQDVENPRATITRLRKLKEVRNCLYCGKRFESYSLLKIKGHTCSDECRKKYYQRYFPTRARNYIHSLVDKHICINCKKPIQPITYYPWRCKECGKKNNMKRKKKSEKIIVMGGQNGTGLEMQKDKT